MDYRGRVAIVTGASSGIGRQTALDLAERGASVMLVARREALLADVAADCEKRGAHAAVVAGDVAERAFVESLVERACSRFGRLDIVVNNAGISKHKQFFHVTTDELETVMRVNFLAAAILTVAALPEMLRRREGWIVNISSVAGKVPPPRETVYAASKFALNGLSEGLWLDLAGSGVHVGVINVGPIDTEIWHTTDEPTAYRGRKYPPSLVSSAVLRCIEERRPEIWVPRVYRLAWLFRIFLPGVYRVASSRFDPVPGEVIEAARRRAEDAATRSSS
jgi:short-subunit dehydrogenase